MRNTERSCVLSAIITFRQRYDIYLCRIIALICSICIYGSFMSCSQSTSSGDGPGSNDPDDKTIEAVATPHISPMSGDFNTALNVTIGCDTDGASIYYTTDGTDPTTASAIYQGGFSLSSSGTIKAIAVKEGMDQSPMTAETYNITLTTVASPIFGVAAGTYSNYQSVSLTSPTPDAEIHYTLDGSEPTSASQLYMNPVAVETSMTIRAIALKNGLIDSAESSAQYTLKAAPPVFDQSAGNYGPPLTVHLSSATSSATIRYSINNTVVNTSSPAYGTGLNLTSDSVVRAYASKQGMLDSDVVSRTYYIIASATNLYLDSQYYDGSPYASMRWVDNSSNETGFKIERKTGNGNFIQIATVGANTTTYKNAGLSSGSYYEYRIRAYNANGDSSYSNIISFTVPNSPAAPTELTVAINYTTDIQELLYVWWSSITLSWIDKAAGSHTFRIEGKKGTYGSWVTQIAIPSSSSFRLPSFETESGATEWYDDMDLNELEIFSFRVRAENSGGVSAWSNTVEKIKPLSAPSCLAPGAFSSSSNPNKFVSISWVNYSSRYNCVVIERKTGSGGSWSVLTTVSKGTAYYEDSTVVARQIYYYRVKARNTASASFDSVYSNETSCQCL